MARTHHGSRFIRPTRVFSSAYHILAVQHVLFSLLPLNSATNENTDGAIQSFVVKSDGLLTDVLATTSTGGNGPAFAIPFSTGEVAAMNVCASLSVSGTLSHPPLHDSQFGGGNGVIVPTEEDPTQFVADAPIITFGDVSTSHPHMALEVGSEVFVPDLVRPSYPNMHTSPPPPTVHDTQSPSPHPACLPSEHDL